MQDQHSKLYRKFGTLLIISGLTFLVVAMGAVMVSLS